RAASFRSNVREQPGHSLKTPLHHSKGPRVDSQPVVHACGGRGSPLWTLAADDRSPFRATESDGEGFYALNCRGEGARPPAIAYGIPRRRRPPRSETKAETQEAAIWDGRGRALPPSRLSSEVARGRWPKNSLVVKDLTVGSPHATGILIS